MMKFCLAAVAALAATAPAHAQNETYGEAQFVISCAGCHGKEGRGDGPMSEDLKVPPADLTRLARDNGGEFPYWRVFFTIDGRRVVPGHGGRDMPIWADEFLPGDEELYGELGGEVVTEERIHQLTEYVETLQR